MYSFDSFRGHCPRGHEFSGPCRPQWLPDERHWVSGSASRPTHCRLDIHGSRQAASGRNRRQDHDVPELHGLRGLRDAGDVPVRSLHRRTHVQQEAEVLIPQQALRYYTTCTYYF